MSQKSDEVARLTELGWTRPEIAGRLGITERHVTRLRAQAGVPGQTGRHSKFTEKEWSQARLLLEDHVSYREVSRTLGIPRTTLQERFPGMGWTLRESGQFGAYLMKLEERLRPV